MADESSVGICGGKSKPKINFLPQVDTTPEMSYEISERELFRCLLSDKTAKEIGETQDNETSKILKDIDLKSKITQVETHKSQNVGQIESENIFVVFHTTGEEDGGHWWSLEESAKSVTMQRSHQETAVKNKFKGKNRNQVETIADGLKGKGSIKDFLILLWIHIVIDLKCQSFLSRCESFIPLVMKKLTETFYEYPPNYFTYSALSSEEINPQVEEIINFLTKVTKWHPLLCLTYLGDIHRFDQVLGKGFLKNKIDGIYNQLTLLNSAILFSKTEMVRHLLEKKKANARKRDKAGRNALNMAALFTDEEEIIKLLLNSKIKVDACDESGMTALHYAIISSNLTVARHLIDLGADFKRLDATGHSPLHLAAHYAKDSQILELLVTKVKIDECDSAGITALHSAAIASNAISARYLIESGANINRVEKRGRTPVHVAAAFAKNMGFFNIFLTNEKADLECCDERKLTVLDYAKINHQHGLAKEIVSGIEKKINDKRSVYSLAKWIPAGLQQLCISGAYKLNLLFTNMIENITRSIPVMNQLLGAESQQKLLFVPDADNEPDVDHEISEAALFRFLLNEETRKQLDEAEIPGMLKVLKDIDKESKITQVEIHQVSMGMVPDLHHIFHVFIVFKSTSETDGDYWWSLEKNPDYIVLQRSRNKENVKDNLYGETRTKVKPIVENLKGKGTIKDLFEILWAQQVILEKYNILNSNSQSLVSLISQQITALGYEFKGYFRYSPPPECGRRRKMLDLINILGGRSEWPPLFTLIEMENFNLLDKIIESGKYDINSFYNEYTPLHFAIMLSKTKMVEHLLQPPMNADPTKRDASGRSALLYAATTTMKAEIFDLLLADNIKVDVDDVDEDGDTALHLAASVSNVTAVQKLLDNGANPNILDKKGLSPLHVAAERRDGNPIIDLLLEAKKVKGMGDVNDQNEQGRTALHYATLASNEITAEHLIKNGADTNCRDDDGDTPLHVAAMLTKNMNIIDLLLQNINQREIEQYKNDEKLFFCAKYNMHGLELKIVARFLKRGIRPPSTETDEVTEESDEGTPLFLAIRANNVNGVRSLLERGADPTIRNNKGETPFHVAAGSDDTDCDILKLLLNSEKVDINETTTEHGVAALHIAIVKSNVNAAAFLLKSGVDPNVVDEDGLTPLHLAAFLAKDMDIVELLLNHPDVDVNCLDNAGQNALEYAKRNKHGNGEIIAKLLKEKGVVERGSKLPELSKKGMRVFRNRNPDEIENFLSDDTVPIEDTISRILEEQFISAIRHSDVESVHRLLKNGAGIGTWGETGGNALHLAAAHAMTTDVIDAILETGKFEINGGDNIERTALHYAITTSNMTTASYLLEKGADPNTSDNVGITPFHLAAIHAKEIETIRLILENRQVDINHCDKLGKTALHYAITKKKVEIVRYLLEKGADPTIRNNEGNNSFQLAPQFLADTDVLGLMLGNEKKIEIDERNKKGETALHLAIATSNVTAARFLLSNGANPNVADEDGLTTLHLAAILAKDMGIVELLLNHPDVDVNYLDNAGKNALYFAKDNMYGNGERIAKLLIEKGAEKTGNFLNDEKVENQVPFENIVKGILEKAFVDSNVGMIRFLIETKADISTVTWGEEGRNALHMASIHAKKSEVLDVILATGKFDINGCDVNGETALHFALHSHKVKTARYLLNKGADPTIRDNKGTLPLHVVAYSATTTDVIILILENERVDINSRDNKGMTPLHYAILASNVTAVKRLLKKGADPTLSDNDGVTLFHRAAIYSKDSEILDLLLAYEKKIEIDKRNKKGETALHLAIATSNVTAARFLLSNGANPNVADREGVTPLHLAACFAKDMRIIELLLNHPDVDGNLATRQRGNEQYEPIANLLEGKTAAKAEGSNRESKKGRGGLVGRWGEDPSMSDNNGVTPLHTAATQSPLYTLQKGMQNQRSSSSDSNKILKRWALTVAKTYSSRLCLRQ